MDKCPYCRYTFKDLAAHAPCPEAAGDGMFDERCPACGDPSDYCQGHGEYGDPVGHKILECHDADDHRLCHPEACEEAA